MNDESNNLPQEGMSQVESKKLNIWGWLIGIGAFLVIILLVVGTLTILQPYIKPYQDTEESYPQKVQTKYGLVEKDYDVVNKEVSLTNDLTQDQILTAKLDTPQVYNVGAGYQKVAQFTINPNQDLNNVLGSFEFYDVNNNMKPVSKQIDVNYLTTKQVEINDYILQCGDNKTGDATCQNIKSGSHFETRETWETFDGNVKTDEPIVIGLFTNVGIDEHIEWIPTIIGVKVEEWSAWSSNLFTDLVMFYQFNETSGTIVHDFQGNFTGQAINTENADWVAGVLDNALSLDGVNEYVNTTFAPNYGLTNNFTISFWFKNRYMNAGEAVWGSESCPSGSEFVFQVNGATGTDWRMRIIGSGDTTNYPITQNLSKGTFQHIVLVRDTTADLIKIYVNGTSVSNTTDGSLNPINLATCPIYIGAVDSVGTTANGHLNATIDLFGIWNRTLNSTEIAALYNSGIGITPPATPSPSLNLILISPEDGTNFTTNTINFSANVSINGVIAVQNVTINVTYPNGTGAYTNVNTSGLLRFYNWTNINFSDGDYNWIAYAYGNDSIKYDATNGTLSFTVNLVEPIVNLTSPSNNTQILDSSMVFEAGLAHGNYTLNNATLLIWFDNGTTFNQTTNTSISGASDSNVSFNISSFEPDDYIWNIKLNYQNPTLGATYLVFAPNNFTFTWIPFEVINEEFNSSVLETSREIFQINVSTSSLFTIQNGRLVYNGTVYPLATKTDLGGGNFSLVQTIFIPAGIDGFASENRTFYWNITFARILTGDTFTQLTDEQNQTVNELIFGLCSLARTVPMVNFTMFDENLGTEINATANPVSFQTTFNLGVHWDYKLKNTSVSNLSVNTNDFDFCTNNQSNIFYANMEALFSANSYTEKNYYLNNATLTNATNEIDLYLLNETDAIEFFITVREGLNPLTLAVVTISKFFIGEGVFKTVEIDKTNTDDGLFTAYLDLDRKYRFSIIDSDGDFRGIVEKTASCDVAPCTLTILVSETEISDSLFADVFATGVIYNISFDPTTKIVSFDFLDTTGLATSFKMIITRGSLNETGDIVYDNEIFTSSGSLTANLSNYTSGDFTVKTFISRSPYQFIDYYFFTISEITEQLGLLGLLVALLVILVIIFGLAYSPPMMVLSVPLALTATKLMGIISLSYGFITLTYILAFIAIISLNR